MRLENKVAVITGAASGIGYATAQMFAAEGANTILVDVDAQGLERCEASIQAAGRLGRAIVTDVSSSSEVKALFEVVAADYGRLDVLFNNAGIGGTGTVVTTTEEEWDRMLAINLKSVYLCCREGIPLMGDRGSIINTSSSFGPIGADNHAAYCAAKAGVINLTRSIAIDFARDNIRANCLVPGSTDTPMVSGLLAKQSDPASSRRFFELLQPMHRFAAPEEMAPMVVFLASNEASYVTGGVFAVDGGYGAGRMTLQDRMDY